MTSAHFIREFYNTNKSTTGPVHIRKTKLNFTSFEQKTPIDLCLGNRLRYILQRATYCFGAYSFSYVLLADKKLK